MSIKCALGLHKWQKMGGAINVGDGQFKQGFVCSVCRKAKYSIY
jgi:hypothetical protein